MRSFALFLLITTLAFGPIGCDDGGSTPPVPKTVVQTVTVVVHDPPNPITLTVQPITPTTPSVTPTIPTTSVNQTPSATLTVYTPLNVTVDSATLRGNINYVWGSSGAVAFQWAMVNSDGTYGVMGIEYLNNHPTGNVSVTLSGRLRPGTNYAYRLVLQVNASTAFYSDIARFTTSVAAQAMAGSAALPNGSVPSSNAKATESLPVPTSILVNTEGYTNLGEDYVTLHGFVDVPNNLTTGVDVFFQISLDGENWNNWYYAGNTKKDGDFGVTVGSLLSNTKYFYRVGAGSSPENSVYGYSSEFTTLALSDIREQLLKMIGDLIGQTNMTARQAEVILTQQINLLSPKSVAYNNDLVSNVYSSAQMLSDISNSQDVDGAISASLAGKIIKALNRASALRSSVQPYFQAVYDTEMVSPYSTFDGTSTVSVGAMVVGNSGSANLPNVYSSAVQLAGKAVSRKVTLVAGSAGAPVEVPTDMLLDVAQVLVDGVNTLVDRTRDVIYRNYNETGTWTVNWAMWLANRAFVASRTLNDFSKLPEVNDLLTPNLKIQINAIKGNIKSLRTEIEGLRDRANASSRQEFRMTTDRVQRRYIDGESNDGPKG